MLEPMKKRRINRITLTFSGPATRKNKAIEAMKSLGFKDLESSVPWREAFPEFKDNTPGLLWRDHDIRKA